MTEWKEYQEKNKDRFLTEMMDLLKIPSVSAQSKHNKDMADCAEAVRNSLLAAGADKAEVMKTEGFPVVYAEKIVDPSKPTVLVYGHYDVQPPEPLELWKTGPFEPVIKDGNVYAVGYIEACDDLRHLYYTVAVLWENGIPTMLANVGPSSNAYSIVIKNNDIYIAGMIGGALTLWRNKESVVKIGIPIPPAYISNYKAKVAVDNNKNVFIIYKGLGYYKNGEFMKIDLLQNYVGANENIDKNLMARSSLKDVFIDNDSLYMVGEDGAMNPFVFSNNKVTYLRDWDLGKRHEWATCIFVINNDVFIGGYEENRNRMFNPIIWKNGVKQRLEYDKINGSQIHDIVVVQKK